ncbi:DNA primase [Patescibacteria group bacterium]|nr:DNA primase [Patescibacteria group bacterium]
MNSPVDKIKERLSIEEVVSSYIKLEKAGANLKARCPFHNEKTPSFFISPDRGTYYCFGCGASGDIFSFVEEFEGLDFKGALKLLANRAGVILEPYNKEAKEDKGEKEKLYEVMEEASLFFEKNLTKNKEVLEYLKKRGLEDKTIKDFRIGFISIEWHLLYSHLLEKGFSELVIEKAGLVKKTEKGMYDRFRGRIIFPIADSSGRIIAFSGRIFKDDGKSAKYLNSPDTPIFKKSSVLYGLDKAKQFIKKNNFSIMVEGQLDLILSHQAGFRNTVATSGTALVDKDRGENNIINNLGIINRLSQNIIFIFDADKAGLAASIRATPIALALFSDMNVKATEIPEGMDPADLISQKGPDAWRKVIRNSKHIIEFLLDKVLAEKNNDVLKTKLEINNKIVPLLSLISNPVKKSHFISLISNKSRISENDIRERLKKEQEQKYKKEEVKENKEVLKITHRKDYIKRRLLGIILWQKSLKEKVIDFEKILGDLSEILKTTPSQLLEKTKIDEEDLIFEAEVFYGGYTEIGKEVGEMINNLKEEYLKEELECKIGDLHKAEDAKDDILSMKILKECQILNNMIQDIKNNRLKK